MINNVLICSAGRRVSLVKYFMEEAKKNIASSSKVFTTDLFPEMSSACLTSDKGFKVGYFSDADYMEVILKVCQENSIKLIIPTIDTELQLLANSRTEFQKKGIDIIVSDQQFIKICRDKRLMNEFFENRGFKVPKKIDKTNLTFPVFVKPIDGSNSKDLYLIDHPDKLSKYILEQDNFMWMEYLPKEKYEEYTVDLYYNKSSELCCVIPRVRIAVRGGETNKGITRKNQVLIDFIRERLGKIEGARGCLTLQVFKNRKKDDEIYGIEINPRFGGGYPLSYLAGGNYPKFLIDEYISDKQITYFQHWEDKKLLLRYDYEMTVNDFDYQ